ncbi:hypothetical protein MASR2M64_06650 [Candidatus Cloacimonadota bacterium]
MYRFATSYYTMEGTERKPQSGVDIRLLRPGQSWSEGKKLIETTPNSGYYEIGIQTEADCGFYEHWDNLGNPAGQISGKSCTIGKLDARCLQNNCIYGNHIEDGVITGNKIANAAISTNHLQDGLLSLSKLQYELQDQDNGMGDNTQSSPANCHDDRFINHKLDKEYEIAPHIILTNQCNCFLYIFDIKQNGTEITITIGIGNNFDAEFAKYQLLALTVIS